MEQEKQIVNKLIERYLFAYDNEKLYEATTNDRAYNKGYFVGVMRTVETLAQFYFPYLKMENGIVWFDDKMKVTYSQILCKPTLIEKLGISEEELEAIRERDLAG